MISALALACIAAAQPQALSFSHPIDTGQIVLQALGRNLGLDLRAAGELTQDRIFVRLRDTDWPTAKQMLAEGLAAKWTRRGDVHYLTRPTAAKPTVPDARQMLGRIKRWQQAFQIDQEFNQKVLTGRLLNSSGDPNSSEASRVASVFTNARDFYNYRDEKAEGTYYLPATRALIRIFQMIDPVVLADIEDSLPRIASARPLARDIPLPRQAGRVLQDFISEQETLRRAVEVAGIGSGLLDSFYFDRPVADASALVVKVFVTDDNIRLYLVRQDATGLAPIGSVAFEAGTYTRSWSLSPMREFLKVTAPLNLTANELALGRFYASLGMYDEETPAGWKDDVDRGSSLAADPVANERLELICGPVLRQLSDAENVSVIALLTDWMWSGPDWLEPNGEADPTVGVALMSMIDGTWLDYSKDWKRNGYWLLTPRNLQEHEQRRYDRKAHRDAISLVSRSRWFDMQFWWFVFSRMKNSDQINALRHDMRGHFEMPSGYAPVEALSLLSSFTASDVALAKSGQLLRPLASLPPKIRSKLTESAVSGTLTSQPRQHDEFGYPIYSRTESDRDEIVDGLIAFRDGIPSRAIARIELQREVRFHPKIKDEENMGEMELSMRAFSRMSPLQIAQYLVTIEEESERAQQWKDSWDFDKVYVSYNDVIRITVDWPGCGFSELHFSIPIEPAFFDRGPLNSLPADARALLNLAIAKEKADIERRRKAAKDGGTK